MPGVRYLILPFIVYIGVVQSAEQLTLNIPSLGLIRGSQMSSASGKNFHGFRGIPYAEPPIGDLRFRDPVPAKPWGEHLLDATKEGPACLQFDILHGKPAGIEDCLVLNVYTPNVHSVEKVLLPVMVWIHGGGFISGSGNGETDVYGPDYILDRDVVFVTINYRLGPFGFLSTEDAEAPGNYGLLDQTLALKWVQDHIYHFGGNPDSVTIFGESAGGASVEFHVLSPRSKGLFHKAIAQSGSTGCPWALQSSVGEYTQKVAGYLNCPSSPSSKLVECLRNKNAKDILETRGKIAMPFALGLYPIAFGPRIDSERDFSFLPDEPATLVSRKQFNSVPFINGLTSNEGGLFAASLFLPDGKQLAEFKKDPIKSVLYSIGMEKRKDGYEIAKKAYYHYFGKDGLMDDKNIGLQYGELSSDMGFFKCVDDSIKLLSKFNDHDTYYYSYAHKGQMSFASMLNIPREIDLGVCHADELFVMFTSKMVPKMNNANDMKVSKTVLDLWTSFATDGIPRSEHVPDQWLPLKGGKMRYLKIDAERPTVINDSMPFQPKLAFWNQLLSSSSSVPEKEEL